MTNLTRCLSATVAVGLLTSCVFNRNVGPSDFLPSMLPSGAQVALRIPGESVDRIGELFAVDSIGVILHLVAGPQHAVARVHWSLQFPMDVEGLGQDFDVRAGTEVPREKQARLALVSRFPQGLNKELLARVLTTLGVDSLTEVPASAAGRPAPEPTAMTLDSLAAATAVATERYADRNVAVRDGYRRIGTDFPGMGEHWIHPTTLLAETLDPARPTMLAYATVDGRPTLNGVGFVLTTRGDSMRRHVPGWPEAWHEHSGLLDEESGAGSSHDHAHAHAHGATTTAPETHVWILHIWTRLPNPESRFAADNWALPFARLGLATPPTVDVGAAMALTLVSGGDDYLRSALRDGGLLEDPSSIDSLVTIARRSVQSIVARPRATPNAMAARDLSDLSAAWRSLSTAVVARLGADAARFFKPAHAAAGGGH